MKKVTSIVFVSLFIILLRVSSHVSYAMDTASSSALNKPPDTTQRGASPSAKTGENTQANMANLKSRADQEIDRRVTSLNNVIVRINGAKHLSAADKTSLSGKAQDQITSLTALKAKIDADTDMTTLKTDVRSIVDSYRVYLLLIPQIHLLAGADAMLEGVAKGNEVVGKLQTKIATTQSAGKDVSALQTSLTDMQARLADASTQANSVIAAVTALTPDGYPANKPTLMTAKNALMTGMQDMRTAAQDARAIIQGLRSLNGIVNSATESGTMKFHGTQVRPTESHAVAPTTSVTTPVVTSTQSGQTSTTSATNH